MSEEYAQLRLENQLCFPLYACSKEIIRLYKPHLEPLGLTYTQYIAMLVLWQRDGLTVKELGKALWLDSGTLTPVLKSLEAKGYVIRKRSEADERAVLISLTGAGQDLREKAAEVPFLVGQCLNLSAEEAAALHTLLYKILNELKEE
ncbi:MAG: MarR family transcriptional regulator [Oscillospiraceae bacterium]|nr:MarR family transcriptional regulator [Oscillospiraceae bacterium]